MDSNFQPVFPRFKICSQKELGHQHVTVPSGVINNDNNIKVWIFNYSRVFNY